MRKKTLMQTTVAALAALVAFAGVAQAQSLTESAAAAADHAEALAASAADDPQAFAETLMAGGAAAEINWTKAWTCESAEAASADVRDALVALGACDELAEEAAVEAADEEEPDGNDTVAQAQELQGDADAAVADTEAAVDEFLDNVGEAPAAATERFVDRITDIVRRIVVDAPATAFSAVAGVFHDAGAAVGGAIGDAIHATGDALVNVGTTTWHGVRSISQGAIDFGRAIADAAGRGQDATADAITDGAEAFVTGTSAVGTAIVEAVTSAVDTISGAFGDVVNGRSGSGGPVTRDVTERLPVVDGGGIDLPIDL